MDRVIYYYVNNETSYLAIFTLVSSTVGISLSVIAFGILILTALTFEEWRRNLKNQILIQFMLARITYTLMRYMYDVTNTFYGCEWGCIVYWDTFVRLYTECALVSWMFVFSKHMNESLVKVFNVRKPCLWKMSLVTWTAPASITAIMYIAYVFRTNGIQIIYLVYVFLFKWPVLCINAILIITALKSILDTNQSKTENNIRIVVTMIILIFVLSFQQILVDTYKIIQIVLKEEQATLFLTTLNILAIYQCSFSIMFWVFGNSNTRKLWKHRNSKLSKQISVTSAQI